jgi:hypothetical protein
MLDLIITRKTMQAKTHLELHNEHLLWKSDLNMWLHDLDIWENEMTELIDNLRIIEKAIEGARTGHQQARTRFEPVGRR